MNPKVSVCMPTYNFARYLPEAIEPVLKQSYSNFEFIIIDDCSKDNSAEVIKEYAEKDKRIVFSINDYNIGMVNNWNLCLKQARGKYIKFIFGDDLFASSKAIEKMVSVLDSNDDVSLVASSRNFIDEQSNNISMIVSKYNGTICCPGIEVIQDCLPNQDNKIGEPSAVMFRKEKASRGFNQNYMHYVDLEMWFHILEQGNFAYIDEPLCSFRIHPEQQSRENLDNYKHLDERFLLLADYLNKPYIKLSRFKKEHIFYTPAYAVWKHYRKHNGMSLTATVTKVNKYYGIYKFIILYPMYKVYKSYLRIKKPVTSRLHTRKCTL
jgi:glycosyltransferase involved in cell wall biosynthesis